MFWKVTIIRVKTGRVLHKKFDRYEKARDYQNRVQEVAARHKAGLRGVLVTLELTASV